MYMFNISPMHALCPGHIICLDLVTFLIYSGGYK
jgi:hypothetical protein